MTNPTVWIILWNLLWNQRYILMAKRIQRSPVEQRSSLFFHCLQNLNNWTVKSPLNINIHTIGGTCGWTLSQPDQQSAPLFWIIAVDIHTKRKKQGGDDHMSEKPYVMLKGFLRGFHGTTNMQHIQWFNKHLTLFGLCLKKKGIPLLLGHPCPDVH